MADFNYTGGVRFAPDKVVDVTADKDGNPTKACNPITGVCLEGGGDSDFSTAEVTITATAAANILGASSMAIPCIVEEAMTGFADVTSGYIDAFEDTMYVCLYKGTAHAYYPNPYNLAISVTGNIVNVGDGYFAISGDGAIALYIGAE